jgi:hypothetical protein
VKAEAQRTILWKILFIESACSEVD